MGLWCARYSLFNLIYSHIFPENCRPPANIPGFAVVRRLRQLVQSFGSITLFKAYADLANESVNPRAAALQSELQSSGVSLTNCPHNGRKDVADKMILGEPTIFMFLTPGNVLTWFE